MKAKLMNIFQLQPKQKSYEEIINRTNIAPKNIPSLQLCTSNPPSGAYKTNLM